jgi:nucleotide-binding universal stress UspA family protein/CBS-domain-containing membrane protein
MFKRILVAYDGSDGAQAALKMGIGLAKNPGTELSSISVEEHLPRYAETITEVEGAREQIDEHFRALAQQARDMAALLGVELETAVRQGHELQSILDFARTCRCDLLVLGSHGHSRVFERVIGSTSLSLVRLASCTVLLVRAERKTDGLSGIKRILVGLDGSPLGSLAFHTALDFAILCGASVVGATVREVSPLARLDEAGAGYIMQLKAAAEEQARAAGVRFEHMTRSGHAAQALREMARDVGVDLILVGATGLEHPWSATIGGTASSVASEAECSVLIVRSPQALMHVEDIMVRAVSSVTTDTPLAEVVELLLRRNVKALPVVDSRRHVVGIITGGDLLTRADLGLRLSIKQELDADTLRDRLRALSDSAKSAREVMSRHVHTVESSADLATVIRQMAAQRIKRLPVVNENRELVGIVSRADVLRAIASLPEPGETAEHAFSTAGRTVADAEITEVPVVTAETPAEEVLQRVLQSPWRRVVVTTPASTVLGVITDRDVLARSSPETRPWILRMLMGTGQRKEEKHAHAHPGPLTAADLMATTLITVRPEDSLGHAARLMMQHRVKRLVVVDEAGRFHGLVDRREVLRLLAG